MTGNNSSRPTTVEAPSEGPEQVIVVTVQLTDEQKTWRKVKIVPSGNEGEGLLVPVETPSPPVPPVLPAVAAMLTAGRATDAEEVFAQLRAAGLALKAVIGADGVLHVTTVSA
jgi:hypothetical protein